MDAIELSKIETEPKLEPQQPEPEPDPDIPFPYVEGYLYLDASSSGIPGGLRLERVKGGFDWSEKQIAALAWVASSGFSLTEVAMAAGAPVHHVRQWARHPEFKNAVTIVRRALLEKWSDIGLRAKEARIAVAEDRLQRLQQVVEERAAAGHSPEAATTAGVDYDEALAAAPGGSTGLVVHNRRIIGTGHRAEVIDEFQVDTASLAQEQKLLEYISREAGQWTERSETTITRKLYVGIRLEDV